MPSQHPTTLRISYASEIFDDEFELHFSLRLLMDLHGPAAVINFAKDHGLRCDYCHACGWVPHLEGECLLCELPLINDL